MNSAAEIVRLHEQLGYSRAYPESKESLLETEARLASFSARRALQQRRQSRVDTGIAGTEIHSPFFWPTAGWLARKWPDRLIIDWDQIDDLEPFARALPLLINPVEATWLRVAKPSPREALAHLAGTGTTDAVHLVNQVQKMPGSDFTREAFYDSLAPPLLLKGGDGTPSRTNAYFPPGRIHYGTPPRRPRPDLWKEIEKPPGSVRNVGARGGERLIDLAREGMVTRGRDLDAFAYGDLRDVRLIQDGDGLSWAMIGLIPERRPPIRTTYGFLTMRNGVPIGYVQADVLWRCVDLAFNTFETFRGHDSAHLLARTMAMLREQFDATSFTLEPYQLGDGNEEGIESGAWWFYYKLGFRPRNPEIRRLVKSELEKIKREPRHRSSPATLRKLAKDYLYLDRPEARAPHWPRLAELATRIDKWSSDDRSALDAVLVAKAGRRDTDYLRLFESHPRLGASLRRLVRA